MVFSEPGRGAAIQFDTSRLPDHKIRTFGLTFGFGSFNFGEAANGAD